MTEGKNQDGVLILLQAIEGHVTASSARYDQLTQSAFYTTADQRMTCEKSYRLLDQLDGLCRRGGIGLDQKIAASLQIRERASGIAQLRQGLAFGLSGLLPAIRALR